MPRYLVQRTFPEGQHIPFEMRGPQSAAVSLNAMRKRA
jgi:hypothetical protein